LLKPIVNISRRDAAVPNRRKSQRLVTLGEWYSQ
jgi:hypothetical protein